MYTHGHNVYNYVQWKTGRNYSWPTYSRNAYTVSRNKYFCYRMYAPFSTLHCSELQNICFFLLFFCRKMFCSKYWLTFTRTFLAATDYVRAVWMVNRRVFWQYKRRLVYDMDWHNCLVIVHTLGVRPASRQFVAGRLGRTGTKREGIQVRSYSPGNATD